MSSHRIHDEAQNPKRGGEDLERGKRHQQHQQKTPLTRVLSTSYYVSKQSTMKILLAVLCTICFSNIGTAFQSLSTMVTTRSRRHTTTGRPTSDIACRPSSSNRPQRFDFKLQSLQKLVDEAIAPGRDKARTIFVGGKGGGTCVENIPIPSSNRHGKLGDDLHHLSCF